MYIKKTADLISKCVNAFHIIEDTCASKENLALIMARRYVYDLKVDELMKIVNDSHFDGIDLEYPKGTLSRKILNDLIHECSVVIAKDFVAEIDRITEIMARKDISDDDFDELGNLKK